MTVLYSFVSSPLAGAIGWAVLRSLWEGALLCAALAAILFLTRSPRVRYAAACAALLLMLAGFAVTFIVVTPASRGVLNPNPRIDPAWNVSAVADSRSAPQSLLAVLAPWLAPFWLLGAAVFYLRHTISCFSVSALRRRGVCAAPTEWKARLELLSSRLSLTRPLSLLESCLVAAPVVLGHFRPVILMPAGLLTGLPAAHIEAILLHELAHIRRYDYLANVCQRLVEGLLFYHPAAWWISHVIREERENCCDDLAVSVSGSAHRYATALAALEQNRFDGHEPLLAATGGSLMKRIRRLLYPRGSHTAWPPAVTLLALLAFAAITLLAWPLPAPQQISSAAEQDSAYRKWLNEDVAYIITPAERVAFERMTTDEERNKFIEQFWERRNPTPGSAANPFKIEHYRRIVFANQHFSSNLPGWKTDRGRTYIAYGPPDELEVHPTPEPTQQWLYRHIDGIGDRVILDFVDPHRTGDYRLTRDPAGAKQ
jgi:GWxTD domain-containing protein